MAKKSSSPDGASKGRKQATVTPDQLRAWAKELTAIADTMSNCADGMNELGIKEYEPVVGNWLAATKQLGVFLGEQVVGKLLGEASKRGLDYTVFINSKRS